MLRDGEKPRGFVIIYNFFESFAFGTVVFVKNGPGVLGNSRCVVRNEVEG